LCHKGEIERIKLQLLFQCAIESLLLTTLVEGSQLFFEKQIDLCQNETYPP
jgi:hypothetical protein